MHDNGNWRKYECINKVVAWICTTIAILCGLYLTKSANCLWAFWIPLIYGGFGSTDKKE